MDTKHPNAQLDENAHAFSPEETQTKAQYYAVIAVCLITTAIALPLGISAYMQGDALLAVVLFGVSVVLLIDVWLFWKQLISAKHAADIAFVPLFSLMLYLVAYGGVENTGPLWIFSLPSAVLFLYGIRKGLISLAIFLALVSILIYFPEPLSLQERYSSEFKARLIFVFALVTLLTLSYAYVTQKLNERLFVLTEALSQMAQEDQLTGLLNRRGGLSILKHMYQLYRLNGTTFSVLLLDIDHFKNVNDHYGHQVGDTVLKHIAQIIKQSVRNIDTVVRWGGEEFLILTAGADKDNARIVAEKIRQNVALNPFKKKSLHIRLHVSIGLAQSSESKNLDKLIRLADERLYRAKTKGRNRVCSI